MDSLSDKIICLKHNIKANRCKWIYNEIDVKEAIKKLKEEICRCKTMVTETRNCYACRNINSIFGEKLTK